MPLQQVNLRLCYVRADDGIRWEADGSPVGGHFSGGLEYLLDHYLETITYLTRNISVHAAPSLALEDGCLNR